MNSSGLDARGVAGLVVSGAVHVGDEIRVLPSGRQSRVTRIRLANRGVDAAVAGESATLTFSDELEVSPGDVVAAADASPAIAQQFEATIMWTHDRPMLQGRSYLMKSGAQTATATVAPLKYKVNVTTLEHVPAKKLELDDIGICGIEVDKPVVFEPYADNRDPELLSRRSSHERDRGCGPAALALRRSQNLLAGARDQQGVAGR